MDFNDGPYLTTGPFAGTTDTQTCRYEQIVPVPRRRLDGMDTDCEKGNSHGGNMTVEKSCNALVLRSFVLL